MLRGSFRLFAACLVALACPGVTPAAPVGFVALGDSLTASYAGMPYAGPNRSWTDLIAEHRGDVLRATNLAVPGSTSTHMLASQPARAASVVQAGGAKFVTIGVGANDVLTFLNNLDTTDPATFDLAPAATVLVKNVTTAVALLRASGAHVIVANVPDITDTPAMKAALADKPELATLLRGLTQVVNVQLAGLAASHGLPLVDLQTLNAVGNRPLMLGGIDVAARLYSVDGFHPSTLGSALIANAHLDALAAYGVEVPRFSESELVALSAQTVREGTTPHGPTPEPASLTLVGLAAVGLLATRRR